MEYETDDWEDQWTAAKLVTRAITSTVEQAHGPCAENAFHRAENMVSTLRHPYEYAYMTRGFELGLERAAGYLPMGLNVVTIHLGHCHQSKYFTPVHIGVQVKTSAGEPRNKKKQIDCHCVKVYGNKKSMVRFKNTQINSKEG